MLPTVIITNNPKAIKDESGNQLLKDSSYIDWLDYWDSTKVQQSQQDYCH